MGNFFDNNVVFTGESTWLRRFNYARIFLGYRIKKEKNR